MYSGRSSCQGGGGRGGTDRGVAGTEGEQPSGRYNGDMGPRILISEGSDAKPLEWLRERATVMEVAYDTPEFAAELSQAQGLIVRTYTRVTEATLDGAPELRVVGRGGVGLENIDVPACRRRGIEVVYTPDANTLAVGDFVFGYLLRMLRPWGFFDQAVPTKSEWKQIRDTERGSQLNELTLGILGMGRVGRRVGHIAAQGFGMRVLYNDLLDVAGSLEFPATAVQKAELYEQSDILSLHVDMKPGNHHLIGAPQLAQMKFGVTLINTCRGEVLDAFALAAALRSGQVGHAALDVFTPEPPAADFPLLGFPQVLLTPHMAARTHTAIENMSWVVRDVLAVLQGQKPTYPAPAAD